jgi:hypothetical protein
MITTLTPTPEAPATIAPALVPLDKKTNSCPPGLVHQPTTQVHLGMRMYRPIQRPKRLRYRHAVCILDQWFGFQERGKEARL